MGSLTVRARASLRLLYLLPDTQEHSFYASYGSGDSGLYGELRQTCWRDMSKKSLTRVCLLLVVIINVGVWLMGVYGLEVRIGSNVFGRYIDVNDSQTWS